MRYLVDGYNLMYAIGLFPAEGKAGLEQARLRLLGLLSADLGEQAAEVTVVFDAAHPPPRAPAELVYRGLHVTFAVGQDKADDLIEEQIRSAAVPKQLTIISDDHHIQQAARRRHCRVWSCGKYMDWLQQRPRPAPAPRAEEPGKPKEMSPEETAHWLKEFADLEGHPGLREMSPPPEFLEDVEE